MARKKISPEEIEQQAKIEAAIEKAAPRIVKLAMRDSKYASAKKRAAEELWGIVWFSIFLAGAAFGAIVALGLAGFIYHVNT